MFLFSPEISILFNESMYLTSSSFLDLHAKSKIVSKILLIFKCHENLLMFEISQILFCLEFYKK